MGKVVAGACVVASFGATAPLTAPLAVAAMGGATPYFKSEQEAEAFIHRCRGWIEDVMCKIHTNECRIGSICSSICELENQKSRYLEERSHHETEKGRMKKVFVFLQDARVFWSDFSSTTQNCISCTALTGRVVRTAEVRGYSLYDSKGTERVLASFKVAWDTFEEINWLSSHLCKLLQLLAMNSTLHWHLHNQANLKTVYSN